MGKSRKMKERYYFFLNPYPDCAFSKCPKCDHATKIKKLPLTIAIKKRKMILNLNKTCRFCQSCELLIARKKEIEQILSADFDKKISEKDYFIMGTTEKLAYIEGAILIGDDTFFDNVYLFKNVWNFAPNRPRWMWNGK
ncbi:hypothetical protein AUJ13_02355 [Candidatus Micrarchaeota archaeon CG1_02_49_24]|nr:MAG: hypothetical protein AUJ13_02355 [Candidatus Micrarchaeota archaeon CG1_02_49_24]